MEGTRFDIVIKTIPCNTKKIDKNIGIFISSSLQKIKWPQQ